VQKLNHLSRVVLSGGETMTRRLLAAIVPMGCLPTLGVAEDGVDAGLPGAALVPCVAAFAGGLPKKTAADDGPGGIGVSGGSENQEENCAQAGRAN
jgi:uncharacterized protein GlcG (DUF336 family)